MVNKPVTHVSEIKKEKVKQLAESMKKKTVMVISIKGLPSAQFQDIKKKLRNKADIQVAKKSLIDFALDHSGVKELHELVKYVQDSSAILFSNEDAFLISGVLADEKSPAKAKAGQIAPENIKVSAGPTELLPGPDISALSAVGLTPKVEDGKISIVNDKVIAKEGSVITPEIASIMSKLDIIPFKVGVEPVAAYMDGKVYSDIKIDKEAMVHELENSYGRALPFAVEIAYVNNETLDYIIGRAGIEEKAIEELMVESKKEVSNNEEVKEETKEEVKEGQEKEVKEETKESGEEKDKEGQEKESGGEKDKTEETKTKEEESSEEK